MISSLIRLLILFGIASIVFGTASAQETAPKVAGRAQIDVTLFIFPNSASTARIGLSYRKKVPHARVESEIKKLIDVSGWKLSQAPGITDKTIHDGVPPTTAAEFSVDFAPQFHDNAPVLSPYLRAFQAWDRIEVLFATPELQPYNGVTHFQNSALDVTLEKSEGIYGYLITIREHSKELPALISEPSRSFGESVGKSQATPGSTPDVNSSAVGSGQTSPSLFRPYLFLITGALLTGGIALYLLAKRHQDNLKPGRLR